MSSSRGSSVQGSQNRRRAPPREGSVMARNTIVAENWKSVVTELHEKKIRTRGSQYGKNLNSSFDSGIQQECNSDNEEITNSICLTLNRLLRLSEEQQTDVSCSKSLSNIQQVDRLFTDGKVGSFASQYVNLCQQTSSTKSKGTDGFSEKSFSSETNNLVEELLLDNSCSADYNVGTDNANSLPHQSLGNIPTKIDERYTQNYDSFEKLNIEYAQPAVCLTNSCQENAVTADTAPTILARAPKIAVAIDIGTSYSGFAYVIDDFRYEKIHTIENVDDNRMKKIPSILLLNPKMEFHSFGNDAKNFFSQMEQNGSLLTSKWLLFEKFKFQLLNILDLNKECRIKAINGLFVPALIVYARTLSHFKRLAVEEISNVLQQPINENQIHWILTIPVTWSIKGKMFMREAAFQAELCTRETIDKLTILYEAESAASWCIFTNWTSLVQHSITHQLESFYFMVINCGGGIVDVTVHQVQDQNDCLITEVHKFSELIYSSVGLDEKFVQLLASVFGDDVINLVEFKKPIILVDLLRQFEALKFFPNDSSRKSVDIVIGEHFLEFCQKIKGTKFDSSSINLHSTEKNLRRDDCILPLAFDLLTIIFQAFLHKITERIKKILENNSPKRKISCIYFTGALIKSDVFQEGIKNTFPKDIAVILANDPELCVMKGSIQKLGSKNLKYSKMTHAYAIGVMKEFEDEKHPTDKLVVKNGRKWCCDLLDWLVKKDQILPKGEVILKRYTPTFSFQSCIVINIYAVEYEDAKFVTDFGVHNCGVLRLSPSSNDKTVQREILLQLIFTGDEFFINALDTLTGDTDCIQLDKLTYL